MVTIFSFNHGLVKTENSFTVEYKITTFFFFFKFIVIISSTTYKNIQYTTLLTLLTRLTTQDYITFSFPFTHTEREKNEKKKNKQTKTKTKTEQKEGKDATYYICTLGTSR